MRVHILKCWPEPFAAIVAGTKTYEIRKDDRGFAVGDFLRLDEWEPGGVTRHNSLYDEGDRWLAPDFRDRNGEHTDRRQWVRVVRKTPGGSWGLPTDVCVMGIEKCEEPAPEGRS